jgi:hypothetical protein
MRKIVILVAAAVLGVGGGYAWATYSAPAARAAVPRKGTIQQLPSSPQERPAELDSEWAQRSGGDDQDAAGSAAQAQAVYYPGCNAVRAAHKAPLYAGQPGYRIGMDGDGDGIACEPRRQ